MSRSKMYEDNDNRASQRRSEHAAGGRRGIVSTIRRFLSTHMGLMSVEEHQQLAGLDFDSHLDALRQRGLI